MKPLRTIQPLTDADLDRALLDARDSILPSSGFAESVMTAIRREAAAPSPLVFPWKRALPGFAAALVALALLVAAIVSFLRGASSSPRTGVLPGSWDLAAQAWLAALLPHSSQILWVASSLAVPVVCLLFCRRLLSAR